MKRIAMLVITVFLLAIAPAFAGTVGLMSTAELKDMLDSDNVVILDVRAGRDWSTSEFKIPGAIRASGEDFADWGNSFPKEKKNRSLLRLTERSDKCRSGTAADCQWLYRCLCLERRLA